MKTFKNKHNVSQPAGHIATLGGIGVKFTFHYFSAYIVFSLSFSFFLSVLRPFVLRLARKEYKEEKRKKKYKEEKISTRPIYVLIEKVHILMELFC